MPGVYENRGIHFQFPENWAVDEEDGLEESTTVNVISPGGAFWSIAVHPCHEDPADLAEAAVAAMRAEYDGLDAEPASEWIADQHLTGYDLNFIWLDLTNTALVRGFRTDRGTYLVLCQAEDREFEQVAIVFRAITTSLFMAAESEVS